jgi:hypothetical protein
MKVPLQGLWRTMNACLEVMPCAAGDGQALSTLRTSFKLAAYAQAACSSHEPQPLTTLDSALQISKLIRWPLLTLRSAGWSCDRLVSLVFQTKVWNRSRTCDRRISVRCSYLLSYPVAVMMGIEPMPCGTPVMAVSVASRASGMRGIHRQSLNTSHRRGGLLP